MNEEGDGVWSLFTLGDWVAPLWLEALVKKLKAGEVGQAEMSLSAFTQAVYTLPFHSGRIPRLTVTLPPSSSSLRSFSVKRRRDGVEGTTKKEQEEDGESEGSSTEKGGVQNGKKEEEKAEKGEKVKEGGEDSQAQKKKGESQERVDGPCKDLREERVQTEKKIQSKHGPTLSFSFDSVRAHTSGSVYVYLHADAFAYSCMYVYVQQCTRARLCVCRFACTCSWVCRESERLLCMRGCGWVFVSQPPCQHLSLQRLVPELLLFLRLPPA